MRRSNSWRTFARANWGKLREQLAQMPPELARKIYDKMLTDLTEKPKPNVRLDDVLALADAVPGEFTWDEVHRLGQLLGLAVPANETYWLSDRLKKGTEKLGGADPAKRLLAGRVLLAGGFKDLARIYLPPLEQVQQIADEGVRNEVTEFLTSQRESEAAQRGQVQRIWDENMRVLTLPKVNDWERTKAAQAMAKVVTQIPPTTLAPVFSDDGEGQPGRRRAPAHAASGSSSRTKPAATNSCARRTSRRRRRIANLLADNVDLSAQPWSQLSQMMAEFWIGEAEKTFTQKTSAANNKERFVAPEELLPTAPDGKWEAALPQGVRERLDATISKIILVGANFDRAADRIVEIGKRNPEAGVALAEDFLTVWAKSHNPQLPEALRKKYELADDARIPVTPIMMEKNMESLARMMALFRAAGIAPKDYEKVVAAFDLAYSDAEAYRAAHIEKVFGPLEKMDEPLFFLILSRMNANLAERWRKMDVQKAGLTRRDETQTLEMVRAGYAGALSMIDALAGRASRRLARAHARRHAAHGLGRLRVFPGARHRRREEAHGRLQGEEFAGAGILPARRGSLRERRAEAHARGLLRGCVSRLVSWPARHRLGRSAQSFQDDESRGAEPRSASRCWRCRARRRRRTSASSRRS